MEVVVVPFTTVSVTVTPFPETTGPETFIHTAEGVLVSPPVVSWTVHVRVGPGSPTSGEPTSVTLAVTVIGFSGTRLVEKC